MTTINVFDKGDGIVVRFVHKKENVDYHMTDKEAESLVRIISNKLNGRWKP